MKVEYLLNLVKARDSSHKVKPQASGEIDQITERHMDIQNKPSHNRITSLNHNINSHRIITNNNTRIPRIKVVRLMTSLGRL